MNVPTPRDDKPLGSLTDPRPAFAGLLGAAGMAWLLVSALRLPPGVPAWAAAAIDILSLAGMNALGVKAAGRILRQNVDGTARRTSITAAWLAPLAVCLAHSSIYAIPVAAIVTAGVVALFRSPEAASSPVISDGQIFHLLEPPPMSRLLSLVCAAFCIQAGLAVRAAGSTVIAVGCVAMGSALITWHGDTRGRSVFKKRRTATASSALALTLVFLLTTAGLKYGFGGDGAGLESDAANGPGGKYWGVFLWPEIQRKAQEIASPPPSSSSLFYNFNDIPLRIRFSGVYWLFKWPHREPPSGALTLEGTLEDFGFRSADDIGLTAEAHQNLAGHVNLSSYRNIDMTIRNADSYPGTVTVGLFVKDTSAHPVQAFSLGQAAVPARLPFGRQSPVDTLRFSVPEFSRPVSFDEITIRFLLRSERATRSPRVAIESLLLIPR